MQTSVQPRASRPATSDEGRYEAIRLRDERAEGQFFYSVKTTGVYCRPTCAARLPRPENVAYHASAEAAEQAGFRPCKRCRPRELTLDAPQRRLVEQARSRLAESEAVLPLRALAAELGISPFHLHRLFKKHVGMTPHAYAAAERLQRMRQELEDGSSVTRALHQAGYSSSSRFYEAESGALGMPAAAIRRGGEGMCLRALALPCSLGLALVAATARGVCAIALGDDEPTLLAELTARFPKATVEPVDEALRALAAQVVSMIDSAQLSSELPLDLIGTAFQQRVWRALRDVPAGTTCSYTELAARIGAPRAVRAVGSACGKNPVAIAVPCHRVVREDGTLGGYRWGLARKRALLARERAT